MNLNSILEEWNKDCILNNNLDDASRATPSLHAKYLQLLTTAKLQLKRSENSQKTLLKAKWLWYNGKMTKEEMEERGWEPDPFHGLKIMKGDLDYYYDSDPEIQTSEEKIAYHKVCIDTLKEIVDALKWRHQTVKNIIEYKKFEAGG